MHHHHHHHVDYDMTACSASIQLRLNHLLQTEASMLVPHMKQPSHLLYSNLCRARTFWKRAHTHTHDSTSFGGYLHFVIFSMFVFIHVAVVLTWAGNAARLREGSQNLGGFIFLTAGQDWTDLEVYQFSLTSLAKGRTGSAYLAIKPKALDIQTPTNTRHKMKLAAVYKYSFLRHSNSHSNANKTQRRALNNLMKNQTYSWTETTCGP